MIKIDMHVHTVKSGDSKITEKDILEKIKNRIIDCVVVTEHNTFQHPGKYPIFFGEEIKTNKGDIIAIGINEEIQKGMSPEETIDKIHEQGGLAIAPHPYYPFFKKGLGKLVETLEIDGIEVFNSRNTSKADRKAMRTALTRNLITTAGSDAHKKEEIGSAFVLSNEEINTIDDIIRGLKRKMFIPMLKNRLHIYRIINFL